MLYKNTEQDLVYLVIGVPGSGKSWVCNQLEAKFHYIHHDGFIYLKHPDKEAYLKAILKVWTSATKPMLIEAPFGIQQIMDPLQKRGLKVTPIFIIEPEPVLRDRYFTREKKSIPEGHITRMRTYKERAKEWNAFSGTSTEVLNYLKSV